MRPLQPADRFPRIIALAKSASRHNDSLGLTFPPGSVQSFWPAVWRTIKTRDWESCAQAMTETSLQGRSRFVLVFSNLSFFLAIKEIYEASMVHSDRTVKLLY